MPESPDLLRLRVLMLFLKEDNTCTVTGISRTLNETKQTISRVIMALEKEGLVDRSNQRHPVLTEKGTQTATRYSERINISLNHLMYEGVDIESAKNDALRWALYNTDNTMEVIRSAEQKHRIKYELRGRSRFSGAYLCQRLEDGEYRFPFIMYREHVHNGSNISMANEAFEHPCTLSIKNGVGTLQIIAVQTAGQSVSTGEIMHGTLKSLQYFDRGSFIGAEKSGNVLSFPAGALQFVNIGEGEGQVLHGTVCMKMQSSVGEAHMPESTAIFTMLI